MELRIIRSGTGAAEVTINGEKKLALTTSLTSRIYKQISRQDLLSEPGVLYKGERSEKWECRESLEYNGNLIFPGPFHEGKTLADIKPDIEILITLAAAFQKITTENSWIDQFYPPAVFITAQRGVLFFPPRLVQYNTDQLPEEEIIKLLQPYNHPEAGKEILLSFVLGVMTYKILTGEFPFTGKTQTEIREKMRRSKPVDISVLKPGIRKSTAEIINKSLSLTLVEIKEWITEFELWKNKGVLTQIPEAEQLRMEKAAAALEKKRQRSFLRSQFFSRNWKTLTLIVIAAALLLAFISQPVRNALEPPITLGMNAREVVETYYRGIMEMDTELMEESVKKGIGKNDINKITQLYVISKVRTGYEGKSGLISAQEWNDGLIKEINPGEQVFGIADLEIRDMGNSRFQVNYIEWNPYMEDNPDPEIIHPPVKTYVKDVITLNRENDIWQITNIERTIEEQ